MAMTRIRVALLPSAVCIAGTDPALKIKDQQTGEVATDRETGASLYFTFIARQREGAELEQWREAKAAACDAIVAAGGTITHHHAVGRDHAPWLHHEASDAGVAALRAVKAQLDPDGIMNPGKLLA